MVVAGVARRGVCLTWLLWCAGDITDDGDVLVMGGNKCGQLGTGDFESRLCPTPGMIWPHIVYLSRKKCVVIVHWIFPFPREISKHMRGGVRTP